MVPNSCFSYLLQSIEFYRIHLHKKKLDFPMIIKQPDPGCWTSLLTVSSLYLNNQWSILKDTLTLISILQLILRYYALFLCWLISKNRQLVSKLHGFTTPCTYQFSCNPFPFTATRLYVFILSCAN